MLPAFSIFGFVLQLSSKRETCGDKSRQLRDAQQDARDKVEVTYRLKSISRKCAQILFNTATYINKNTKFSVMLSRKVIETLDQDPCICLVKTYFS